MHLSVRNLAKIESAEMDFNGITLVVGNNNTGKSTAGKILYAIFNSMYNFKERIYRERYNACRRALRPILKTPSRGYGGMEQDAGFISDFLNSSKSDEQIRYAIESLAKFRRVDVDLAQVLSEMEAARKPTDDEMRKRLVRDYFSSVFHDQYLSLFNTRRGAVVELTIKSMVTRVVLRKASTALSRKFEIEHPAYYIDTPELLRNLNDSWMDCQGSGLGESLVSAIRTGIVEQRANRQSVLDGIMSDERIGRVFGGFRAVLDGAFLYDDARNIVFKDRRFKESLELDNLSVGLKSFGLILAAVKYQALKPRDVIILDEPEVHLHPEWQLKYAELIVLLQKTLDLTVLLTSHSPDFIQALYLYAKKHGVSARLNAYVSRQEANGMVTFDGVPSENWDMVFDKFMSPMDKITALREELEARDES